MYCNTTYLLMMISALLVELMLIVIAGLAIRRNPEHGLGSTLAANAAAFLGLSAVAASKLNVVFCAVDPRWIGLGWIAVCLAAFLAWVATSAVLIWRLWPKQVVQYGQDTAEEPIVDGKECVFQVTRQDNCLIVTLSTGEADFHREFRVVLDQQKAIQWAACIGAILSGSRTDAPFAAGHACAFFAREGDGIRIDGFDEASPDTRTVCRFTREQASQIQELVTPLVARPNR